MTSAEMPPPGGATEDHLVEAAFDQAAHTLGIFTVDGEVTWINQATLGQFGLEREAVIGHRLHELDWSTLRDSSSPFADGQVLAGVARLIREVGRTGEVVHHEVTTATADDPDVVATWDVTLSPVRDRSGRVYAVSGVVADISEQTRARRRLVVLNQAGDRIAGSLDIDRTAQALVDSFVPEFCDFASVDLDVSVASGGEPSGALRGDSVEMRRSATQSVNPGVHAALAPPDGISRFPAESPQARCLSLGRTVLSERAGHEDGHRIATDTDSAPSETDEAVEVLLAIPLHTRGVTLGVAVLTRFGEEAFLPADVLLAEELCARAAVSIDNARHFMRERSTALTLQRELLPQRLPRQAAVEVESQYVPADSHLGVGGDWFDVVPLSSMRVALIIGDVVGHGLHAAVAMGRLRIAMRTLAETDLAPDELLTHLDDLVGSLSDQEGADPSALVGERYATCLYAVYDPVSRELSLASAGHPPPAIVAPDGAVQFVDVVPGPPLGIGGLPFEAARITLAEGSIIALHTDGLLTNRRHDLGEGQRLLQDVLSRTAPSLEGTAEQVIATMCTEGNPDDVALLLARTRRLDEEHVASWDLPADSAVVSHARQLAAAQVTAWGLDSSVFVTELVVSELVTNAIRHADLPIRLRLLRGEKSLICEVSDGSNTAPHLRRANANDEGGRGLLLVAQTTRQWGTRHTARGKTIWTDLDVTE